MTRMMVMEEADADTLPLAEIKARLSEIVDRIESRHERITLTRNGRPAVVLISPDDLEALEILSDPKAVFRDRARPRADSTG
ncbi:MAG: type II toxin-antitoxin system Phd/YefM family antitoxin [Actinomycetota bacterium]